MAYLRGIMKQDIGVRNASEIVKLMQENIESKTEKFQKFIIKEMEPCQRPSSKDLARKSEPITGINKMHSIWIDSCGKLRSCEISCKHCTVKIRCKNCKSSYY